MSLLVTLWEYPTIRRTADDYDEIETIRIKSISEIAPIMANLPARCKAVSIQHTSFRTLKNGKKTDFFKWIWEYPAKEWNSGTYKGTFPIAIDSWKPKRKVS